MVPITRELNGQRLEAVDVVIREDGRLPFEVPTVVIMQRLYISIVGCCAEFNRIDIVL